MSITNSKNFEVRKVIEEKFMDRAFTCMDTGVSNSAKAFREMEADGEIQEVGSRKRRSGYSTLWRVTPSFRSTKEVGQERNFSDAIFHLLIPESYIPPVFHPHTMTARTHQLRG